jgi:cytochrome P450
VSSNAPDVAYFDVADPKFSFHSEQVFRARDADWYAHTPYGYAVLRYDEVTWLLKDKRLGQGSRKWPEHNGVSGDFNDWWKRSLINLVAEDHRRQRRVLNPAFAARPIDAMASVFRELADARIDTFINRGSCDFVSEFSQPFATLVICRLVGVGEDRWQQLADWTSTMGLSLGVTIRQQISGIENALARLTEFADEVIEERLHDPGAEDTVAMFMTAHADGRLTRRELNETIVNMFFGGVETTRNQLGIAIDLFIEHPNQWELLADNPELAPAAVEEVMRVRPTTTWVTREALEDFTYKDLSIKQGTTVHLLTSVIGSDPSVYGAAPFDITAARAKQVGFGGGAHHCLGHFLARKDMSEALTALSSRLTDLQRAGEATWLPDSGNTGPMSLPISFEARA